MAQQIKITQSESENIFIVDSGDEILIRDENETVVIERKNIPALIAALTEISKQP